MVSDSFAKYLEPLLFPVKLYKLAHSNEVKSVNWSRGGSAVKIDTKILPKECFRRVFNVADCKHVFRQLSYYGFHRIHKVADIWEFQHPHFHSDRFDLVQTIKRASKRKQKADLKEILPFIERRQSARLQSKENTKRGRFDFSSLEEDACSEETQTVEAVKTETRPITSKKCKRRIDYAETYNNRSRCSTETNDSKSTNSQRSRSGKNFSLLQQCRQVKKEPKKNRTCKTLDVQNGETCIQDNIPFVKSSNDSDGDQVENAPSHHATLSEEEEGKMGRAPGLGRTYLHDYENMYINAYNDFSTPDKYECLKVQQESVKSSPPFDIMDLISENSNSSATENFKSTDEKSSNDKSSVFLLDESCDTIMTNTVSGSGFSNYKNEFDNMINSFSDSKREENPSSYFDTTWDTLTKTNALNSLGFPSCKSESFVLGKTYNWAPIDINYTGKRFEEKPVIKLSKSTLNSSQISKQCTSSAKQKITEESNLLPSEFGICESSQNYKVFTPLQINVTPNQNISNIQNHPCIEVKELVVPKESQLKSNNVLLNACSSSQVQVYGSSLQSVIISQSNSSQTYSMLKPRTIINDTVVLSTQSVSSHLDRSLSECNASQSKYPSSRLAYLCKNEPPVSSKRPNILGKWATQKQDNAMNSSSEILIKGKASVVPMRIVPFKLKVIDKKTPIISQYLECASSSQMPGTSKMSLQTVSQSLTTDSTLPPSTASWTLTTDSTLSPSTASVSSTEEYIDVITEFRNPFCKPVAQIDPLSTKTPQTGNANGAFSNNSFEKIHTPVNEVTNRAEIDSILNISKTNLVPTSFAVNTVQSSSGICSSGKDTKISLSEEERQNLMEYLYTQVKEGKMYTWDVLEHSNPVIRYYAYDALTLDVDKTLKSLHNNQNLF